MFPAVKWQYRLPRYCYALKDTPEEESSFAPEIIEFDAAAGKFKSESIALSREVPFFCSGRNGVYYVVNNTVEKLDPQNNSNSTLLRWDETDINPTGVSLCNVLSDDEMYALSVVETWDMHFSTTIDPDITLYHMTRAEKNPHAGKKIIELASFQGVPSILMEQIVDYNKDPQKNSRIVVKDYSDEPTIFPQKEVSEEKRLSETIDKVYLDLKAHTGPDILVNFFQRQVVICLIEGILYGTGFMLVGVPYGFLLGFLLGVLNLVPFLGTLLCLPIILPVAYFGDGGSLLRLIGALSVWLVGQFLDGYLITPKIQGEKTGLGYAGVIFSFFFWGVVFHSILGLLLAIPLSACCVVLWRALKERYIKGVI